MATTAQIILLCHLVPEMDQQLVSDYYYYYLLSLLLLLSLILLLLLLLLLLYTSQYNLYTARVTPLISMEIYF